MGYVMWLLAPRENLSLAARQDIEASVEGEHAPGLLLLTGSISLAPSALPSLDRLPLGEPK